ncbi:ANTAR domain-containing protein [Amycolatopsis carbonis]|uniref:ANTAR domain-containing protein n=1 Tax=Amycolatopsis carbonis TaxID=715471 RepID=A0A9Y2N180_9PSEU|nr:ANTAR domain-containing protein [Amycolatopsis sp. 2-15]WIX82707.1 ANTAR domain-containing protein [Amycolatopsis sp. 2-15]
MSSDLEPVEQAAKVEQLAAALATRPVIEQAKGMLMLVRSLTDDEAFEALREVSQHTNVKLHDVATVVVASGTGAQPELPAETADAVLAELRAGVLGSDFGAES